MSKSPKGPTSSASSDSFRSDAQAWLASLVNSSDDAIVSKTLQGIVTTWNQGAERIFGYTEQEMVGRPILTIIPHDRQDEETMILTRLRRGERVDHFETIRRRKDGTLINVSVTISPVRNSEGVIVGVSKIARDITLWKRIQAELTAARQIAEEAQRNAEAANHAKDHFLSVLSHELRTPLTPILAAISLIEKNQQLPPDLLEQIAMIRRNVQTEARLVDDLLDLTKIARGKMPLHFEVIDAHAVVRNVVAMFQREIEEKSLALTMALRAKEHHVWADVGRFQQMLLNLLSNAIKFTPRQGSITLQSSNEDKMLQLQVSDSGVGIDAELMPRLFNAFEQGQQSISCQFGGLGLGLSIVKSLVEMHNGSVTASSPGKDQGATFTIEMPSTSLAEQKHVDGAAIPATRMTGRRVLLVEDHADTRQILGLLLRNLGCEITTAGSVKEAIGHAEEKNFDLLISDIGLPDGTGIHVVQHMNQMRPTKAIAITGFGQDEDIRRSKDAGFDIHLTKPVHFDALERAIQQLIA